MLPQVKLDYFFLAKAGSRASGLPVTVPPPLPNRTPVCSCGDLNNFSRHRSAEKQPWCFHMLCPSLPALLLPVISGQWQEDAGPQGFPGKGQRWPVLQKNTSLTFSSLLECLETHQIILAVISKVGSVCWKQVNVFS